MKELTSTLLILSFFLSISFATNNPELKENNFKIEEISFEMNIETYEKWNVSATYTVEDESFQLSTISDIQFLQILNADSSLVFQLPIFSKEVTLDLGDFTQGDYQLNLMMKNDEIITSTFTK